MMAKMGAWEKSESGGGYELECGIRWKTERSEIEEEERWSIWVVVKSGTHTFSKKYKR